MKLHLPKGLLVAVVGVVGSIAQSAMGEGEVLTVTPDDFSLSGGSQKSTIYKFEKPLVATETQELSFSFTINIGASIWNTAPNTDYNCLTGLAFIGSEKAFVFGSLHYNECESFGYATSTNTDVDFYILQGSGGYTSGQVVTDYKAFDGLEQYPTATDMKIDGSVKKDQTGDGYTLTLTYDNKSQTVGLGSTVDLNRIVFYSDGSSAATVTGLTLTGYYPGILQWGGTNENYTWDATGNNTPWKNDFTGNTGSCTVEFGELSEGDNNVVKIKGDVRASLVKINDDYEFQADGTASLISELQIANGKTLEINAVTLNLRGKNAISGGTLTITGATVVATYESSENSSVISNTTTVKIKDGGTLHLKGHDMLGYTNEVAPEITLASTDSTQKATLHFEDTGSNTLGATINMNGNAQITGNKINTFGTTLSVTKTGNEVSVDTIQMRKNTDNNVEIWEVEVKELGELTLSSQLVDHGDGVANLEKEGAGKLMITSTESTWSGIMKVNGGTLELVEAATLGNATVEVAAGSTLKTGTGTIKTLTFADGAKLEADTTVKLGGVLTLGSNITLDGDLLTNVKALTAGNTVTLFEGVTELHLGDDIYSKGDLNSASAEDLGNWFTLSDTEAVALFSDSATTIGSGYYLGYDTNGTVYAGMAAIPEPTTATLSLLALAALAARRRRK